MFLLFLPRVLARSSVVPTLGECSKQIPQFLIPLEFYNHSASCGTMCRPGDSRTTCCTMVRMTRAMKWGSKSRYFARAWAITCQGASLSISVVCYTESSQRRRPNSRCPRPNMFGASDSEELPCKQRTVSPLRILPAQHHRDPAVRLGFCEPPCMARPSYPDATDEKGPTPRNIGFVGKGKGKHDKRNRKGKTKTLSMGYGKDKGCGKDQETARTVTRASPTARAQARMTTMEVRRRSCPLTVRCAASTVTMRSTAAEASRNNAAPLQQCRPTTAPRQMPP